MGEADMQLVAVVAGRGVEEGAGLGRRDRAAAWWSEDVADLAAPTGVSAAR